jgi:heptosyltransferase II
METQTVPHLNRLVIGAPNWLGDAVMALPAIADARRAWPDAHIAVAARPSVAPLFTLFPRRAGAPGVLGMDDVITLDGTSGSDAALKAQSFDAALLLTNSFHTAWIAWRAGIPERWGYRGDWRGPLLTRAFRRPAGVHQAEYYQQLARGLGCRNGPQRPLITVEPDVRRAGADQLKAAGWDGHAPLVAMAPGAAYGGAKRWPAESFAAVAGELARRDHAAIVLIGTPADAAAGADVERAAGGTILNVIGRTDLRALAGVLAQCRGLVTNDSGAMHLAAALGVAVTAMFGPTRERETRPLGPEGAAAPAVLTHDVWCRPCMLRECPLVHRCMRGITVDAVLTAARRTL